MGDKADIAVIKNDIKHIAAAVERIEKVLEETHKQAIKTNGRVNVLEVKQKEVEDLDIAKRVNLLEKWKYGLGLTFTVVFSLVSFAGYRVLAWSLNGMMKENLQEFSREIEKKMDDKIEIRIKKVLSNYQFEIIK